MWATVALLGGLLVAWAYLAVAPAPALQGEIVGRATVLDGDTIEIRGERLRLHGIDAPESSQSCQDWAGRDYRCGQRASFALADKIAAANVRCELLDRDHYGRHIARCFLRDVDLNDWMVRHGQAVAYRRYSMDYAHAEDVARQARVGIWQGAFDLPWDWRQGNRSPSARTAGGADSAPKLGCLIKGNTSANGKIYHLPGQRFYDRTRIDPQKGQRLFCSEAEARAAGRRRALQ